MNRAYFKKERACQTSLRIQPTKIYSALYKEDKWLLMWILLLFSAQLEHLWGTLGSQESCPVGHYAVGFRTKLDDSGDSDKKGLAGVQLKCSDPAGKVLTSSEGPWGSWDSSFHECQAGFKAVRGEAQDNQGVKG